MVQFKKMTKREKIAIEQIVVRAFEMKATSDILSLEMDLIALHQNEVQLNFNKLLKADDFNFIHDICGIQKNIGRITGKLLNHFLPRCAR